MTNLNESKEQIFTEDKLVDDMLVHASHCCQWHGCKYGDPACPVVLGKTKQLFPCDYCLDDLDDETYHKDALNQIEKIKKYFNK